MSQPSNDLKAQLIRDFLETPGGAAKLAQAMAKPLWRRRDYQSFARSAFIVEPLPQGALPIYDQGADVAATVIGEYTIPMRKVTDWEAPPIGEVVPKPFPKINRSGDMFPINYGSRFTLLEESGPNVYVRQVSTGDEKWVVKSAIRKGTIEEAFYDADPTWRP